MQAEPGRPDGRLDHLLQLGMMVLFWHIAVVAIVAWGSGHIEQSLHDDVAAALRSSGFRNVRVGVEGREVALTGEVADPAEQQRAIATAAMVPGTYLVDASELRLTAPLPAAPAVDGPSHLESAAMDEIHSLLQSQVGFTGPTSSRLTEASRATLGSVAALFHQHPGVRGTIEARTAPEVAEQSPGLAERRANVVASILMAEGIPASRVRVRAGEGVTPLGAPSFGFLPDSAGEAEVTPPMLQAPPSVEAP